MCVTYKKLRVTSIEPWSKKPELFRELLAMPWPMWVPSHRKLNRFPGHWLPEVVIFIHSWCATLIQRGKSPTRRLSRNSVGVKLTPSSFHGGRRIWGTPRPSLEETESRVQLPRSFYVVLNFTCIKSASSINLTVPCHLWKSTEYCFHLALQQAAKPHEYWMVLETQYIFYF